MPLAPARLAVLATSALVGLAAVAGGCTRRTVAGLPPGVEVEDLPESESWDVRLRTSTDGVAEVALEAPYLARYTRDSLYTYLGPAPGDAAAAPVTLRLFGPDGRPTGSVRAREVWMVEADGRLVAEGAVRASRLGSDGATVEAARVVVQGERIEAEGGVRAEVQGGGGARVEAPRVVVGEGGAFTASGGATVEIGGSAQATVRARTVSGGGGRYEADGGVRVLASGGRVLEAGRVVWSEAAGRFTAPGAFRFDGPGERVRGVGLTASADLSRYSFRDVRGEIEVQE